jgi:hypothetical protein
MGPGACCRGAVDREGCGEVLPAVSTVDHNLPYHAPLGALDCCGAGATFAVTVLADGSTIT